MHGYALFWLIAISATMSLNILKSSKHLLKEIAVRERGDRYEYYSHSARHRSWFLAVLSVHQDLPIIILMNDVYSLRVSTLMIFNGLDQDLPRIGNWLQTSQIL